MELQEKIKLILDTRRKAIDRMPSCRLNGLAEELGVSTPTLRKIYEKKPGVSEPLTTWIETKLDRIMPTVNE